MQRLLRVSHAIDAMMELLGQLSLILVTLLLGIGVYNVIARYIGRFIGRNLSSNVFIEGQWYLFSLIFFLGFAFILKRNAHVRVDFLYSKFTAKRRALINMFGTFFFLFPFSILGIYMTWQPVLFSWGRRANGTWGMWELSPDPDGLPRAPIKTLIIVAFVLLIIQGVSELIKHVAVLTDAVKEEEIAAIEEYQQQGVD